MHFQFVNTNDRKLKTICVEKETRVTLCANGTTEYSPNTIFDGQTK